LFGGFGEIVEIRDSKRGFFGEMFWGMGSDTRSALAALGTKSPPILPYDGAKRRASKMATAETDAIS
jgi:hypothetical protein